MALPTLAATNHSSFVAAHALTLVLYAAPWCTHRSRLLRTLTTAADLLPASERAAIALCEDSALAQQAGAADRPALRLHWPSRALAEPFHLDVLEGGTEPPAIAAFLRRQARSAPLRVASREALQEELRSADSMQGVTAVLFADEGAEEAATLDAVATEPQWQGRVSFVVAPSALATHFDDEQPNQPQQLQQQQPAPVSSLFAVYRGGSAEPELLVRGVALGALRQPGALRRHVQAHAQPLLAQIGAHNYAEYAYSGRPLVWLFVNGSCCADANRRARAAAAAAAAAHRGAASFVWLDGEMYAHHARALGAGAALPAVAAEADDAHFVYVGASDDAAALEAWATAVLGGRVAPTLRSAQPPAANSGPVTTVVASTLDALVLRPQGRGVATLLYVRAPGQSRRRRLGGSMAGQRGSSDCIRRRLGAAL